MIVERKAEEVSALLFQCYLLQLLFCSFDTRRQSSPTEEKKKGTAQALRDKTLQMLAPDLIEKDPLVSPILLVCQSQREKCNFFSLL